MFKALRYRSILPEVVFRRMELLSAKDLEELIGSGDLEKIRAKLEKTCYAEELMSIPMQAVAFEKALEKHLIKLCDEIFIKSPNDIKRLIWAFMKKFDAENIKLILAAKSAGMPVDQALTYIVPAKTIEESRCRRILESSKSVEDVINLLLDTEYGPALREGLSEYKRLQEITPLKWNLDKYVYQEIWKAVKKIRGFDGKIAKELIGAEIELLNIKIILRCKKMKVEDPMKFIVPVFFKLSKQNFKEAAESTDTMGSILLLIKAARFAIAREYEYAFKEALQQYESSESLSLVETVLDKTLLNINLKVSRAYPSLIHAGSILTLLNLKLFEIRNLRAIIKGVEDKFPPGKISELLILLS